MKALGAFGAIGQAQNMEGGSSQGDDCAEEN